MEIQDTFAEAFGIQVSRLLVTAATKKLAKIAATEATGYGTSVIGCPAEAGIDCYVPPQETPDGRPGYIIMICNMSKKKLDHELLERVGMCILTAATTAVFDAMEDADEGLTTGKKLKFYGDGYEKKIEVDGRTIQVQFDNTENGLTAKGGKLSEFEIAGKDVKYHKAEAKIVDNEVWVTSSKVAEPLSVRYCWRNGASASLFNSAGLPALQFRTNR